MVSETAGPTSPNTADTELRHRVARRVALLAVVLLTFLVFAPAIDNDFVDWDDPANILDNPGIRGFGLPQLEWMFTTFHMGHYQPLTWLSLALDSTWGSRVFEDSPYGPGLDPRAFHATNVLLHAINAGLLFLIAFRLLGGRGGGPERGRWAALAGAGFAALVFSLHPLRVESVAWATERRDLLSGALLLLTVLAYLRAAEPEAARRRKWLALSIGLFLAAVLSKVIVVTLPVVLLVLDWYPLRRIGPAAGGWTGPATRSAIVEKWPFLLISLVFGLVAVAGQGSNDWLIPLTEHGLAGRLVQSAFGLVFYLGKTLVPTGLIPLYEMHAPLHLVEPRFAVSVVVVVVAAIVLVLVRNRAPALVAAALVYGIFLLPVLGLVQNGPQLVADRYSYLACLGWAVLAGAGLAWCGRRSPPAGATAAGLAAMVVLALGPMTRRQIGVWRDNETFWRYVIDSDPRSSIGYDAYAMALARGGDLEAAVDHFERSLEIKPLRPNVIYNYGNALLRLDRNEEAATQYRRALALTPGPKVPQYAHGNLAMVLIRLGRLDEAERECERALELDPSLASAQYGLARVYHMTGRRDQAIAMLEHLVEQHPEDELARNQLGMLKKEGTKGLRD